MSAHRCEPLFYLVIGNLIASAALCKCTCSNLLLQNGVLIHYIEAADILSVELYVLILVSAEYFILAPFWLFEGAFKIGVYTCKHKVNVLTATLSVQVGIGVSIPTLDTRGVGLHLLSVDPSHIVSTCNYVIACRQLGDGLACGSVLRGIKINVVSTRAFVKVEVLHKIIGNAVIVGKRFWMTLFVISPNITDSIIVVGGVAVAHQYDVAACSFVQVNVYTRFGALVKQFFV